MGTYNVSKIEGWLKDFTSAKNKFNNTYYSDYKNSYIRSCNDSAVIKMRNKLNQYYDRINRINNRIKNVWDDFLYDLKAIDNRLAGGKGSTNDSAVASKLSKLPTLKEYKADLKVRINSASAVVGTVDKLGWTEDKTTLENIGYVLERTEATIAVAGVSVIEGVVKLGEDAVDLLALGGALIASEYTGVMDLGSMVAAKVTGNDSLKTEYTKQVWEETRAFVSKDYTGQAFDWLYENTAGGQYLKENAYGFDTVRAVGAEVGEVVGVVVLSIFTGGGAAYMYGAAKVAEHTEENWQDENTSTAGGFFKGAFQGVGDGFFFGIGMKGDAVMKSAATAIVKEGGKQTIKKTAVLAGKTLFECGCSVAQDGTNIMINALFANDTITTPDGQTIRFDNFNDKLNFYYEQAGGLEGMMTSMATASVLSFGSDVVDVNKIMKNVDTNAVLKNADINTSSTKKSVSNIENIKSKNKGNTFVGDKIGGSASDPDVLKRIDEWRNSKAVNTSNPKNTNVKSSNDIKVNPLSKEYDDLLRKTKEPWFLQAKEARDNGWAWNLKEVNEVDNIVKRMEELEGTLGVKNTVVSESKIYNYSGAKKEADALANEIRKKPIPGYENIDTNSPEYQKASKEYYSKPSPSGKQDLSQFKKPKGNTFVGDKVGGSTSDSIKANNNFINEKSMGLEMKVKATNDSYINTRINKVPSWFIDSTYNIDYLKKYNIKGAYIMNKSSFIPDNIKLINKNIRHGRAIINITDDIDPNDVFSIFKNPNNIIVVKNGYQFTSNGSILWLKNPKIDYGAKFAEFDRMINIFEQHYPGESYERIKNYLKTGNEYQLTSKNGIRTYVTRNCNVDDLVKYLDYKQNPLYDDFSDMLNEFIKYYPDEAIVRLKMYAKNGNLSDITRKGNIRNYVETLDKNYIKECLDGIVDIKSDKQVYDILSDFVKECDKMGVDGYDIIREISTNSRKITDFPKKYVDKLGNADIEQIERNFYKLRIDQSHPFVKETQEFYYKLIDNGILNISKFDVDRALSNVKVHDTFESFQKAFGTSDASHVCGFANSKTGEIHIRPGQSIETIFHETNHLLGNIIRHGIIKIGNYSVPWEYRGLNEGATEYIAQKFAKLKGKNTRPAYKFAYDAIEKIDEAFEKLETGTSVTEIYMNKNTDSLKTFFNSVMGNDSAYDRLDNAASILAYPDIIFDEIEKKYNISLNRDAIKKSCKDIINDVMGEFEINVKKILKGK